MTPEEINKLAQGLERAVRENEERKRKEVEEFRRTPIEHHLALIEHLDEERNAYREALIDQTQSASQLEESYKKGPRKQSERAWGRIEEIWEIMQERKTQRPDLSDASHRNSANRELGRRLKSKGEWNGEGGFFKDDAYLRKRLKQYRASLQGKES